MAQLTFVFMVAVASPVAWGAAGRIVTGTDASAAGPHLKAFTSLSRTNVASFFAYPTTFTGGVRVAAGDVNGDGAADIITGTGHGAAQVRVFSGRTLAELHAFFPYGTGFSGGIFVAAGDVNGDGFDDIVTGTDAGVGPHVKVFSGTTGTELYSFFAYPAGFTGGVRVAAGDINNDGRADIITGSGPGGGPHVKVFDGGSQAEIRSFFAYDVTFSGGVFVASGDVTGAGRINIITGTDSGTAPHVKVFDGTSLAIIHSFFAYTPGFLGGVRVAASDMDGDGRDEILTAPGAGMEPLVTVLDGLSLAETGSLLAYPASFTGGLFVGAASLKQPRLEIGPTRTPQEIQLQWPAGCLCELESNPDPSDPQAWSKLELRPVDNGNRLGLLLPAVQKLQTFRLRCDAEAVRP